MTKADAAAPDVPGVGGAPLQRSREGAIACWYSEGGVTSGAAKDELLAFHGVVQSFFQAGAVVPFRFPTTLADAATLSAWLKANATAVARELNRLSGRAQMEVHIVVKKNPAPSGGREYLEGRRDAQSALRDAGVAARQRVAGLAAEWRERETREGLRCYALVARGREREFAEKIGEGGASSPAVTVRVTGPWPPAEFLDPALTTPS